MPILAGLETEYGLQVEGSGPEEQVAHARALVECHGGPCHVGWDYRDESPRNDLRGFQLKKLAQDLADAVFDRSAERLPAAVERADRVLPNGARLYNDHGHPEYATPECWTLRELALHDAAGELVVGAAARAYEEKLGRRVRVFKNNTDGHGASYGTHESYLAPRSFGFARLYRSVTPVLAVRSLLTGAGKAGAESGPPCRFQSSQRADFLVEPANAETLARRPVFNTRDEPHADPAEWIRMHVIAGDASMSPATTVRKVGLVKIALRLEELGECPSWALDSPPRAMAETSRCLDGTNRIMLEGGSWTTPAEILRSYAEAALAVLDPRDRYDAELRAVAEECLELLGRAAQRDEPFSRAVDWACKLGMIESFFAAEGQGWDAEAARGLDLAYSSLDPDEGLYPALCAMGAAEPADYEAARARASAVFEPTRALARSVAVARFPDRVAATSWGRLALHTKESVREFRLDPGRCYGDAVAAAQDADALALALEPTP